MVQPRSGARMQPRAFPELAEGAQALGETWEKRKPRRGERAVLAHTPEPLRCALLASIHHRMLFSTVVPHAALPPDPTPERPFSKHKSIPPAQCQCKRTSPTGQNA